MRARLLRAEQNGTIIDDDFYPWSKDEISDEALTIRLIDHFATRGWD